MRVTLSRHHVLAAALAERHRAGLRGSRPSLEGGCDDSPGPSGGLVGGGNSSGRPLSPFPVYPPKFPCGLVSGSFGENYNYISAVGMHDRGDTTALPLAASSTPAPCFPASLALGAS